MGRASSTQENRKMYRILVGKPEGKTRKRIILRWFIER
jgi:hypothetical protein